MFKKFNSNHPGWLLFYILFKYSVISLALYLVVLLLELNYIVLYISIFILTTIYSYRIADLSIHYSRETKSDQQSTPSDRAWWSNYYQGISNALLLTLLLGLLTLFTIEALKGHEEENARLDTLLNEIQSSINSIAVHALETIQDKNLVDCTRQDNRLVQQGFAGANLAFGDFTWCNDLSGTDFRSAILSGVNFTGNDLSQAKMKGAELTGAILVRTTLSGAALELAVLRGADLRLATLQNVNLLRADLSDADFEGADFSYNSDISTNHTNLEIADITQANGINANFTDALMRGAILERANLTDAKFLRADLTNADLSYAILIHANLCGANLTNAILNGARLSGTTINNQTVFSEGTVLPDGSYYRKGINWSEVPGILDLGDEQNCNPINN